MENQTSWQKAYSVFIVSISIISLLLIGYVTLLDRDLMNFQALIIIDYVICAIFFFDFLLSLYQAKDKRRYLLTWGWFDLISSIPATLLLGFRFARVVRIGRVLRGLRAGKILANYIAQHRARTGLIGALLLSVLFILICGLLILQVEKGSGGTINTFEDALWWAVSTMTTVGYGDQIPVSTDGKIIAAVLMFAGIGMFGVVSGLLAAWFMAPARQEEEREIRALLMEADMLKEKMEGLDLKMEKLLGYLQEQGDQK